MSAASFKSIAPCFLVADVGATISWYEKELDSTAFPSQQTSLMLLQSCLATESRSCCKRDHASL